MLSLKDIICSYTHRETRDEGVRCEHLYSACQVAYYIHKQKFANCLPKFELFLWSH